MPSPQLGFAPEIGAALITLASTIIGGFVAHRISQTEWRAAQLQRDLAREAMARDAEKAQGIAPLSPLLLLGVGAVAIYALSRRG